MSRDRSLSGYDVLISECGHVKIVVCPGMVFLISECGHV